MSSVLGDSVRDVRLFLRMAGRADGLARAEILTDAVVVLREGVADARTPRYPVGVEWGYYIARAEDGVVLSIARRRGPEIQILAHDGEWVDEPSILTRFQDADYYESVPVEEAEAAARSVEIEWAA